MTGSVKKLFLFAALAGTVTAGVLLSRPDVSVSEPSAADVMHEAAGLVEQNKVQPCADEAGQQSAIRLTEPGMSCK